MEQFVPDFPMPAGDIWQYELIRWLQSFVHPWLNKFAYIMSMIGTESFYLAILPILFWSVNRTLGLRAAYIVLSSLYVNVWLKAVLQIVRPIGIPGIRSYYTQTAVGYSMPSGHAQGSATFFTVAARWVRRPAFAVVAFLLVFLIGVSRVYLGLHWPLDVLVGWGLGLVIGWVGWTLGRWWTYREIPFRMRAALAILWPGVMLLLQQDKDCLLIAAVVLGLGVGALIEERCLRLEMGRAWWKRVCTAVIGIAGLVAIQWVTKSIGATSVGPLVRGVLFGLWGTLGAPYLFLLCGLYERRVSE